LRLPLGGYHRFSGRNASSLGHQATDLSTGQSVRFKKIILNTGLALVGYSESSSGLLAQLGRCLTHLLLNKTREVGGAAKS
jgi:hypothetical protein